jgi:hypothetical protein
MIEIARVDLEIIEKSLLRLGRGNHDDNMKRLRRFECHCSVSLFEEEFFGLVFLQSDEVVEIAPRGDDRRLQAVAKRAISLGQPKLSGNWNLAENLDLMREKLRNESISQEPLTICEAKDGEEAHGPWYLQDGSHRALAYSTLVLLQEIEYFPQKAYCSMSQGRYAEMLSRRTV